MIKDKLYFNYSQNRGLVLLSKERAPHARNILSEWINCELRNGETIPNLLSDAANPNDKEFSYGANVYAWRIISNEYVIIHNIFNGEIDVKEYVLLTLAQYVYLLRTYMSQLEQTKSKIKERDNTKQYFEVEYFAEGPRAKEIAHLLLNVDYEVFY